MSKIIAVCGSPESGKTTASLKLAQELYYQKKGSVIFLSPDMCVPSMAFIFPHSKTSDLYSIGKALDKTDIYQEDILKQLVPVKTMRDFGFFGYTAGENKYSYPRPTEDKITALFRVMKEIADYVIIDCVSDMDDLITRMAINRSDNVIQMVAPDLKSIAYYASQAEMYENIVERGIKALCIRDRDIYLPIEEVKSHFKDISFVLPYSRPLKQQVITGTLSERLSDIHYRKQVAAIAKRVI
ncbi:MAG: hypothetical protein PHV95_00615 [Eubacteriales bacterium]|nr:hypothetical protein [Eubacteriales bacterium]